METLEPACPALAEHLKEYEYIFNQVACDCNLPNTPLKSDYCCCNTFHISSHAVFHTPSYSSLRDCLQSPQTIDPSLQQCLCSPPPVYSSCLSVHHTHVSSYEVYDNHTELVQIMEWLIEEAYIECMEGLNIGNQVIF